MAIGALTLQLEAQGKRGISSNAMFGRICFDIEHCSSEYNPFIEKNLFSIAVARVDESQHAVGGAYDFLESAFIIRSE